jgi:hypothetical protein
MGQLPSIGKPTKGEGGEALLQIGDVYFARTLSKKASLKQR